MIMSIVMSLGRECGRQKILVESVSHLFPLRSAPAIGRDRSSGVMFTACIAVGVDNDVANHVVSCKKSKMFLSGCLALFAMARIRYECVYELLAVFVLLSRFNFPPKEVSDKVNRKWILRLL